jgi:hypothetical protein
MFLQHDFMLLQLNMYHLLSMPYDHFTQKYWLAHELLIPPCVIIEVTV